MNEENTRFYEELKKQRNIKKITLEEISEYTKINMKYLDALEIGDFSSLPNVYIRLFLRSYCDYIGSDYKKALDEYEIYTIGDRKRSDTDSIISEDPKNEEASTNKSNISNNISGKAQNYKELIIATTVITIIIILFIILNLLNK
ncbi:MAG: hypothetical protein CMG13_03020 [Candidatus Marinimicrobia bacterium]|nr:hypothetical protein [Candidatus Neomarinimicrobiota bacterium]|tara:strand:- start:6591 stop:7025 length:435 start_codon:yes stop_codon:yes gene_type:complete